MLVAITSYSHRNAIERLLGHGKRSHRGFNRHDGTAITVGVYVTLAFIADQRR